MFVRFSLRQMLMQKFGVDLPVLGGFGHSINEAVIIESEGGGSYRQVEDDYLKCVCMARGAKWEILQRDRIDSGERIIEEVKIKRQYFRFFSWVEKYYFDITDCVVPPAQRKKTHRDFPQLISELEARDVVFRMDFSSRERRSKAPWLAPFGKDEIKADDDALWEKLFEGRISEEAALDAMTDLMERYCEKPYPLPRKWSKK